MDDLHKLHKIHEWMWKIDKKYPTMPMSDEAWSEIIDGCDALVTELELEPGCYARRLLYVWRTLKEDLHTQAMLAA